MIVLLLTAGRCGQRVSAWPCHVVAAAGGQPDTVMPIERAVPAMIFSAASTDVVLRSAIFVWAISRTWAEVTVPTLFLCGSLLPFSIPAAFLISSGAGGVFVTKSNVRSS